jgi:peptidoglycan/xylan/chitin deacetylase (PgdA/CDA1 family)
MKAEAQRQPPSLGNRLVRRARSLIRSTPKPAILLYHRIADERFDPWGLAVSPTRFAAQLHWLRRHRQVLPLEEFTRLQREGRLPAKATAITFDDGYACNAEIAAPLLRERGLTATIFLPAEIVGRQQGYWWHELEQLVLNTEQVEVEVAGRREALGDRTAADDEWRAGSPPRTPRQQAFWRLWTMLRASSSEAIRDALDSLKEGCPNYGEVPTPRPMRPEQVRQLRSAGLQFGSHGLSHASLPTLNPEAKRREIARSREACAELVGERPSAFAYPFGDKDGECEDLVRAAGYECACTTEPHAVDAGASSFALPRIQVGNWSAPRLSRALAEA